MMIEGNHRHDVNVKTGDGIGEVGPAYGSHAAGLGMTKPMTMP